MAYEKVDMEALGKVLSLFETGGNLFEGVPEFLCSQLECVRVGCEASS